MIRTGTHQFHIVRDTIVQSHDRFQQLTRDIMWLNVTIYNQSEIYMKIRQLVCLVAAYKVCPKSHEIYFFVALLLVAGCSNRLGEVGGPLSS